MVQAAEREHHEPDEDNERQNDKNVMNVGINCQRSEAERKGQEYRTGDQDGVAEQHEHLFHPVVHHNDHERHFLYLGGVQKRLLFDNTLMIPILISKVKQFYGVFLGYPIISCIQNRKA